MKIESNIKLFNTEKEAQEFIDKHIEIEAVAYEFNTSSGSILWAICMPDADETCDTDFDTFLDEEDDHVIRHQVKFQEIEE